MKIYKYNIPVGNSVMQIGGLKKVVSAVCQYENIAMYCEVEPADVIAKELEVKVVGTGHDFDPSGYTFVNTVVTCDGALIWHVYVRIK